MGDWWWLYGDICSGIGDDFTSLQPFCPNACLCAFQVGTATGTLCPATCSRADQPNISSQACIHGLCPLGGLDEHRIVDGYACGLYDSIFYSDTWHKLTCIATRADYSPKCCGNAIEESESSEEGCSLCSGLRDDQLLPHV